MAATVSRRVTLIGTPRPRAGWGHAGRPRLWAYGYPELAAFLGTTEGAVRVAVARGTLNPASLEALYAAARRRREPPG